MLHTGRAIASAKEHCALPDGNQPTGVHAQHGTWRARNVWRPAAPSRGTLRPTHRQGGAETRLSFKTLLRRFSPR